MPIYEYQCQKCGEVSEYMQKMSDPPMTVCEACGGPLERLISKSSFHLKGGGWYKDLYSSTPRGGGNGSDGSSGSSGSSGSTSGDSSSKSSSDSSSKSSGDGGSKTAAAAKD